MMTVRTRITARNFLRVAFAAPQILNPFEVLRAQERLNKFRALDDAALKDAGLTRRDVETAKLTDFLNMPNRHR